MFFVKSNRSWSGTIPSRVYAHICVHIHLRTRLVDNKENKKSQHSYNIKFSVQVYR